MCLNVWMAHVCKLIGMKRGNVAAVVIVQLEIVCEKVVVMVVVVERFVNNLGLYGGIDL